MSATVNRSPGFAAHVDDEIGAHGGAQHDAPAGRLVRLDRLAVERNYRRPMVLELEPEDPRIGGVDQTQAHALAGAHREGLQDAAVDRDRVADPAIVAAVHEVAEIVADLSVRQQAPVVEHPGHVAVDLDRLPLLDDQRAVEAAADLLEAALVRVVPVGAGVGHVELVDEGLAGCDRLLGQMRHAVHGVRHAQAVPVDGRLLGELVLDRDAETLALTDPDLRARNRAVVGPDGGLGVRGADEVRSPGTGNEVVVGRGGLRATRPGREQCSDGSTTARGQKRPAGKRNDLRRLHLRNSPSDGDGSCQQRRSRAKLAPEADMWTPSHPQARALRR